MKGRPPYSKEVEEKVKEMKGFGVTNMQIGKESNIHYNTVGRILGTKPRAKVVKMSNEYFDWNDYKSEIL